MTYRPRPGKSLRSTPVDIATDITVDLEDRPHA
jgi:hypothetical protein